MIEKQIEHLLSLSGKQLSEYVSKDDTPAAMVAMGMKILNDVKNGDVTNTLSIIKQLLGNKSIIKKVFDENPIAFNPYNQSALEAPKTTNTEIEEIPLEIQLISKGYGVALACEMAGIGGEVFNEMYNGFNLIETKKQKGKKIIKNQQNQQNQNYRQLCEKAIKFAMLNPSKEIPEHERVLHIRPFNFYGIKNVEEPIEWNECDPVYIDSDRLITWYQSLKTERELAWGLGMKFEDYLHWSRDFLEYQMFLNNERNDNRAASRISSSFKTGK